MKIFNILEKKMGNKNEPFRAHLDYFLFQRQIQNVLNNNCPNKIGIRKGYIIDNEWLKEWKKIMGYDYLYKIFEDINIKSTELTVLQKEYIDKKIESEGIFILPDFPNIEEKENFIPIVEKIITNEKCLENFVDEKTFQILKKDNKIKFEEIKYTLKKI